MPIEEKLLVGAGGGALARVLGKGRKERLCPLGRVALTARLARAIVQARSPAFISGSAVGFYGDTGDAWVDESSPRGRGFLADTAAAFVQRNPGQMTKTVVSSRQAIPKSIRLEFVTPERAIAHEDVDEVELPGEEGFFAVLPGHAPLLAALPDDDQPSAHSPESCAYVIYTSGSTGKPKGVLHTSAGYLCYAAFTHKYVFDYHDGDIYWCTADVGWVTGHSYIVYGPLANGATTLMFEGVPNYPDSSRFWQVIDKHQVNIFYTAPTAIRALMREGEAPVKKATRKSLRLLGSVGEPINPEAWLWYYKVVGDSRCPIVDTWWQTETGGILITPLPGATKLKPGSATRPFFGCQPLLVDAEGLAWQFRGASVKCVAEEDFMTNTGERQRTNKVSPAIKKWADTMTAKFVDLERADPIFAELHNCMELAVVATLIAQQDLPRRAGYSFAGLLDADAYQKVADAG